MYRSIPETAGIFATYPSPHLSIAGGALDQLLGTLLLLLCICAITDPRNMKVGSCCTRIFNIWEVGSYRFRGTP